MPRADLRRLLNVRVLLVLAASLMLGACSGGDDEEDDIDMPIAFSLVGQADFTTGVANRGATTSALGLAQPLGGVATDGAKFYVADYSNNRVLGWNSIPASPATAPDFVIGQDSYTANTAGTAANALALPAGVFIAGSKLIVADSGNNRVLIWNTLPTANTPADVVLGQSDFVSDDPTTSATGLSFPLAAAVGNNKLFVVDQNNNRVLIWNTVPTESGTAADLVLGQSNFTDNDTGDEENGLNNPAALWTDGFRLLVADSGNNRVMYWSAIPRVSNADATYVIGQTDFARTTEGVGQASLRTPYGIASDGTRIYIADAGNNRVLKFDAFPIASGADASDIYGQDSYSARTANDDDQDGTNDADDDSDNDTDPTSERTLNSPTGVTNYSGVLYVSDRNNHRVMFFPD